MRPVIDDECIDIKRWTKQIFEAMLLDELLRPHRREGSLMNVRRRCEREELTNPIEEALGSF